MPAGNFMFNTGVRGFGSALIEPWTRNGGAAQANNDFCCLFLGTGASAILDVDGCEDYDTIGAITGLAALECTSSGYTPNGMVLIGRTATVDDTNNRTLYDATDIAIATLATAGGVNTITDLLIFWEPNSGTLANGIPICRISLGQTYTAQGAAFNVTWSALGVFYGQ